MTTEVTETAREKEKKPNGEEKGNAATGTPTGEKTDTGTESKIDRGIPTGTKTEKEHGATVAIATKKGPKMDNPVMLETIERERESEKKQKSKQATTPVQSKKRTMQKLTRKMKVQQILFSNEMNPFLWKIF